MTVCSDCCSAACLSFPPLLKQSADLCCFLSQPGEDIGSFSICSCRAHGNIGTGGGGGAGGVEGYLISTSPASFPPLRLPAHLLPRPTGICRMIKLPIITAYYHQITVIQSNDRAHLDGCSCSYTHTHTHTHTHTLKQGCSFSRPLRPANSVPVKMLMGRPTSLINCTCVCEMVGLRQRLSSSIYIQEHLCS